MLKRWTFITVFVLILIGEGIGSNISDDFEKGLHFSADEPLAINSINLFRSDIFLLDFEFNLQDTTTKAASSDEAAKDVGFIKKLFTGATKAEKIAKKEKKNLKAINESQIQFYGWLPFWMLDAYTNYNFNSLTTVSFFSVDAYLDNHDQVSFRENGINEKLASDLFKKANSAGCRIDLTFKCEDEDVIDLLLNNDTIRNKCINYLTYLLDTSNLMTDGIAIVFENLPPNNAGSLIHFIAQLKQSIKQSNRSIKLAIPEFDASKNYDILKLNKLVDNYLLIGNNFFRPETRDISALNKNEGNGSFKVRESVKEYLKRGVPYNKLIVVLPNHGIVWHEHPDEYVRNLQKSISTVDLLKYLYEKKPKPEYDAKNDYHYFFYEKNQVLLMCYPENKNALEKNYKWLIEQGIAGIGIWALGYDNNDTDFWKQIDKNFTIKKLKPTNKEILIRETKQQDSVITFIRYNDTIVKYTSLIKDTLIRDTLFNRLLLDGLEEDDSTSTPAFIMQIINKFKSTFESVSSNPIVIASVIITLVLFGLIGILGSLLFSSVRELLYIKTIPKYIFIHIVLILFGIGLLSFLNLLRHDLENIVKSGLHNFYIDFDSLKKGAWYFLLLALIIINLLSTKLFGTFSLKHDKP